MKIEDFLMAKLNVINNSIKTYKKNLIEEIEKEQIILATTDLLILRDLKEQQGLIKKLLKMEEEQNNDNS